MRSYLLVALVFSGLACGGKKALLQRLEANPNDSEALGSMAKMEYKADQFPEALKYYKRLKSQTNLSPRQGYRKLICEVQTGTRVKEAWAEIEAFRHKIPAPYRRVKKGSVVFKAPEHWIIFSKNEKRERSVTIASYFNEAGFESDSQFTGKEVVEFEGTVVFGPEVGLNFRIVHPGSSTRGDEYVEYSEFVYRDVKEMVEKDLRRMKRQGRYEDPKAFYFVKGRTAEGTTKIMKIEGKDYKSTHLSPFLGYITASRETKRRDAEKGSRMLYIDITCRSADAGKLFTMQGFLFGSPATLKIYLEELDSVLKTLRVV